MIESEQKQRVLFVSPLTSSVVGGIAKWSANIWNYYNKEIVRTSVELVPCYNENINNQLIDGGIWWRLKKGFANYLPLIKKVRKELRFGNIDVVHICTSASVSLIKDLAIIYLARKYGAKTIVHFHFGRIPNIFQRNDWEKKLLKRVIGSVDRVVLMDMASYNTLAQQGYNHICYIPNPLSLETQECIDHNISNIRRDEKKVVFVGQMLEAKGIYELAEACRNIDGIRVLFIGPIPNEYVKDKLHTLIGEEKMTICGAMPYKEVIKEMLSASVFVLPTYSEGFPNVIIESMACGCPIVATPVGAIPEMLNVNDKKRRCGICVPVKNVVLLEKAVRYILDNPHEAALLGQLARQRVYEEYSIQKVWNLLQDTWVRI